MNMNQAVAHFSLIYSRSNAVYLGGLGQRINFLNLAIAALQDTIRKRRNDKEAQGRALARVFSWLLCVADHFRDLPVARALAEKYPSTGCGYCGNSPCNCNDARLAHRSEPADSTQVGWSIARWQSHMDSVYGERNRQNGIDNVLNRLFKEISELLELHVGVSHANASLDDLEHEFALEVADGIAWAIATAIVLNIDLESAIQSLYGKGCPSCRCKACNCRRYILVGKDLQRLPQGLGSSSLPSP